MVSDTLVPDQTDHPGEAVAVVAAGAVPWRVNSNGLEVLLIHRPRYDDWSWPKGKIDDGETIPECAAREVLEEIGLSASLGIPLPPIHYRVASGLKVVHYWAVHANGARLIPDGNEVDSIMWCSPEKAAGLLSNPSDVVPLEHLQAWWPPRVVTSPWRRCVATVAPYSRATGAKVKLVDALTEHRHNRTPKKTAAVIAALLDKQQAVAVCTHRPALPTVLGQLGKHMAPRLRALLPSSDPFLSPGELLVCHVAAGRKNRIVAVEQFKPFDD